VIYLFLSLSIVIVSLIASVSSKVIPPKIWGPSCVILLSLTVAALGAASLFGTTTIGVFSHPVFGKVAALCDPLSSWFMLIVGVLFAIGAVYGAAYLSHYKTDTRQLALHWLSFLFTLLGLEVLLTTDNLIVFLVGWEFMAIGSFFAVIFEYEHPQVIKAGLNYFIQSHVAVLLITVIFAWAIVSSGSTTFNGLRQFFETSSTTVQIVAMSMLIAGFGFKAGFVPFHSWLPLAHPAAPSHISALMSGVIVKAGIYGIIRFGSMVATPAAQLPIGATLLIIGIISGLYGILNAAEHRDFKRMLAYCTIENVGIIAMGLGIGFIGLSQHSEVWAMLGFGGALLHTLNHAIFKALLFFGAGNVYVRTHTRNMEELGGLGKLMPRTSVIFLVGSLAIGALPPLGGFLSELLIYDGFLKGFSSASLPISILMALAGCSLAVIGGISMLAFTKTYGVIFLGTPRKELAHTPAEVDKQMLWPAYALMVLMALVMLFPSQIVSHLFSTSLFTFGLSSSSVDINSLNGIVSLTRTVGHAMLGLIILILVISIIRRFIGTKRPVAEGDTWGCGYKRPIVGIQYTSKSFSKTLLDMCRTFLPSTSRFTPITSEEIFPKNRSHISVDHDLIDEKLVTPGTDAMQVGLKRFQFIQNGMLQRYIVYGLAYVAILVATIIIFN